MEILIGDRIPHFSAFDINGQLQSSDQCNGVWTLLFFYSSTSNYKPLLKDLNGIANSLHTLSISTIAIAQGSVTEQKKVALDENILITLIADENIEVIRLFGMWKPHVGYNNTFLTVMPTLILVDPHQSVRGIYEIENNEIIEGVEHLIESIGIQVKLAETTEEKEIYHHEEADFTTLF